MTLADWLVIAAGVAAIVWVNWYFFFAERQAARAREGVHPAQGWHVRLHMRPGDDARQADRGLNGTPVSNRKPTWTETGL